MCYGLSEYFVVDNNHGYVDTDIDSSIVLIVLSSQNSVYQYKCIQNVNGLAAASG